MQQSTLSLWYRLSQVPPSSMPHHACSSWGNLAIDECPLWESRHRWASCFLQLTQPSRSMLTWQSSLLNLHAWTYSPEPPTASTKFTGKPGDVLLVAMSDHLTFHYLTRRWHENLATTDYVHCRTPLPQTATMLTSGPFIFLLSTCPAKHAPRSHLLSTSSHPMTWSVHKPTSLELWLVQRKD